LPVNKALAGKYKPGKKQKLCNFFHGLFLSFLDG